MDNQSTRRTSSYSVVIGGALLLAISLGLFIATQRVTNFEQTTSQQLTEQETRLTTIADTLVRNGVDIETERLIRDCAPDSRQRFDLLLGQLDQGLATAELNELNQLFTSCASLYADRKQAMVQKLTREVEVYATLATLQNTLTLLDTTVQTKVALWQSLAQEEQTQSELFSNLVESQQQIITALLAGQSSQSGEIVDILTAVQETREGQLFSRQQALVIREKLTN